jgi:hypothetical protein
MTVTGSSACFNGAEALPRVDRNVPVRTMSTIRDEQAMALCHEFPTSCARPDATRGEAGPTAVPEIRCNFDRCVEVARATRCSASRIPPK